MIKNTGLVVGLLCVVSIAVAAACAGKDATSNNNRALIASGEVAPQTSATIALNNGASVQVPAGSVTQTVTIQVATVDPTILAAEAPSDTAQPIAFTPHDSKFANAVTVTLPAAPGADQVLRLDNEQDSTWEEVQGVSFANGIATFSTTHFCVYVTTKRAASSGSGGASGVGGTSSANAGSSAGAGTLATGGQLALGGSSSSIATGGAAVTLGGMAAIGGSAGVGGMSLLATGGTSVATGGANATGGQVATGGKAGVGGTSSIATGGTSAATGGAKATGGAVATGGINATGGASVTGGANATGGSSAATGGAIATGGASAVTGGVSSTGGTSAAALFCINADVANPVCYTMASAKSTSCATSAQQCCGNSTCSAAINCTLSAPANESTCRVGLNDTGATLYNAIRQCIATTVEGCPSLQVALN